MASCYHDDDWDPPHHLIYREEIKKDGEKEVLCWDCEEPIWGSLHTCVECGNRPVHNYKSTINHCLDFTEKLENDGNKEVCCWGCNELVLGPAYKCSSCSFFIHNSCAELLPEIDHPMHPDHTLYLREPGRNCCHACSTSHDISLFYKCGSCDYQLDIDCANRFSFINPNECRQHEFLFIWRWVQLNCEACGETIMGRFFGVCNICKLLVHKRCAEIARTVKIKLHNHSLNLVYYSYKIKKREDIFCRFCCIKVSTKYAAYCCDECNFFVHLQCVQKFIDRYGKSLATGESMQSDIGRVLIKALNHVEDKGSHPGEIQHFSHQQHKLILCDDEVKEDKLCEGCMEFIISVPFYKCAECDFFLHTRCAKLPIKIEQYRLHYFHTLTLLPQASNKNGVFYCDLCDRHRRGFAYKCDTCWEEKERVKTLDVQCGSIPEMLKHEGHQHTLFLALDFRYRDCKACPSDIGFYSFVCTRCDFILGLRCANLPLVARHKYDIHHLKLTYTAEANYGEYYCLICKETRDPNHWFYYCKTCDFPAHIKCVLRTNNS